MKQILLAAFLFLNTWSGADTNGLFCLNKLASKLRVAIVAGVSSGSAIPARFKRLGLVESVHVMPEEGLPHGYSIKKDDYIDFVEYDASLDAMAAKLRALGVTVVLPGSEMGVELADALSEKLGLVTNGSLGSKARRNKFLMQEVIKHYKSARFPDGIPGIRQREITSLADFKKWHADENESQWPVVIKPTEAAATVGVKICENFDDVQAVLEESIGKPNFLGKIQHVMLAQEFLKKGVRWENGKRIVIPATEYVVDMVSLGGKRIVSDVWKYHKKLTKRPGGGLSNVYNIDELLDPYDAISEELIAYANEVLDALGIQNGASHMEIMMTDRGPVLVEVGARLIGGDSHLAVEEATGVNPITLLYEAYFEPEKFLERWKETPRLKKTKKHTWMVQLFSHRAGRITGIPGETQLRAVKGVTHVALSVAPGDDAELTVDLITSPGQVIVASDDKAQMEASLAAIRRLEPTLFTYENWFQKIGRKISPWLPATRGALRR